MNLKDNSNKRLLRGLGYIGLGVILLLGIGFIAIKCLYNGLMVKDEPALSDLPTYTRNESPLEGDLNKNIAIFGVDKDGIRTDVIFVVNLNTETSAIKVIAVPRDTKVNWTSFQQEKMQELEKGYYEYSKITEMSSHGGIDHLRYFTISTLEDIMGLHIDHYAVINISAFRKIVDAIGGVEVDVPRVMQYTDNYQDLHIDLQPGLQVLNGEQAEGLVRWRHNEDYSDQYAEGDVGRIETQQLFLKALAHKILNESTPLDLFKIATTIYADLKTDIKLEEIKDYLQYLSHFSVDKITFATLPGEAVRQDKWYYILNQQEVDAFMQKILYDRDIPLQTDELTYEEESSIKETLEELSSAPELESSAVEEEVNSSTPSAPPVSKESTEENLEESLPSTEPESSRAEEEMNSPMPSAPPVSEESTGENLEESLPSTEPESSRAEEEIDSPTPSASTAKEETPKDDNVEVVPTPSSEAIMITPIPPNDFAE